MMISTIADKFTRPLPELTAGEFVEAMIAILGMGYHPDTAGADYVTDDGARVFSDECAREIDETTARLMADGADLYDLGMEIFQGKLISD